MKTIDQYPVTFPYGETSPPYSSTHKHRGDDRAAPQGTPVIVAGTQIGVVGATGLATGPHLHLQEWNGNPANTRKPQNSFKGGTVVAATSASDFGNYVTIQTEDGWNDTYAHLSRIDVKVGERIGMEPANEGDLANIFEAVYALPVEQNDKDFWLPAMKNMTFKQLFYAVKDSQRYAVEHFVNNGDIVNLKYKGIDASKTKGQMWKQAAYNMQGIGGVTKETALKYVEDNLK